MILDTGEGGTVLPNSEVFILSKRRSYTTEFKLEAAQLVVEHGYGIRQACEAVGVGETAMRRWVDQLRAERGGHTPSCGPALTAEQRRIQELELRLRKVEREKEILKKATALLMSDSLDRSS